MLLGDDEGLRVDIARAFPRSRLAGSKRLRVLLDASPVVSRRPRRARLYRQVPPPLRDAAAPFHAFDAT